MQKILCRSNFKEAATTSTLKAANSSKLAFIEKKVLFRKSFQETSWVFIILQH
jgi:hypothetical protein